VISSIPVLKTELHVSAIITSLKTVLQQFSVNAPYKDYGSKCPWDWTVSLSIYLPPGPMRVHKTNIMEAMIKAIA
jgi:hypothetical protein